MRKKPSQQKTEPQEDFWDLGDDETLEEIAPVDDGEEAEIESPMAEEAEGSLGEELVEVSEESEPEIELPEEGDEVMEETEESDDADEEPLAPLSTHKEPLPSTVAPKNDEEAGAVKGRLAQWEKIALAAFVVILVGIAGWILHLFYQEAPKSSSEDFREDFPMKGNEITVSAVDTWWRKPVREGDTSDQGVVIRAKLIPCARIILSGGGSATLQVSFRNGEGTLVGDTLSLAVRDGKFAATDSPEIIVNSTNGFEEVTDLHGYANGDLKPWSLNITEEGDSSGPFVKARISAASPKS